jgi:hypothetical protein
VGVGVDGWAFRLCGHRGCTDQRLTLHHDRMLSLQTLSGSGSRVEQFVLRGQGSHYRDTAATQLNVRQLIMTALAVWETWQRLG